MARDFRNKFSIEEYIDKLFRFLFFLHPMEGLKVIERNMKESDNADLKKYNEKLLEDYQKLINKLEWLNESSDRVNVLKILEQLGGFVGVKILTIYIYLKGSGKYGDIRNANELFQKKMNDTLKLGSLVQRILSNLQFDLPIFLIAPRPKPRRSHRYACVCGAALSEKYSASNYQKLNFRCTR